MRYFRYRNTSKNLNSALKEQYKTLIEEEKRTFRKEKFRRKFSTIVTLVVYFSCIIVGIFLFKTVPQPYTCFLKLLVVIFKVIIGIIILIVSGVLTVGLTMPLWKKLNRSISPQ